MGIEDLRRDYQRPALDPNSLDPSPFRQFSTWFEDVHSADLPDWFEVNAMTLATADERGFVTARIVLLKGYSEAGFMFFTNYDSAKGQQLLENPRASLVFYWPHVERQIRVNGSVTKTEAATSDKYFHARPRGSQLGAVASAQSQPLADRQSLEQQAAELDQRYADQEIPRPDYWGGYLLEPDSLEFWQGRNNRLHDRFSYDLEAGGKWKITRLAP